MAAKKKKKPVSKKKKPIATKGAKKVAKKKKVAPKAKKQVAKKKVVAKKTAKPIRREDRAGHLDPKYAKKLLAESGKKESRDDAKRGAFRVKDDAYANARGREFVDEANSGEDEKEDNEDRVEEEERGGPFVVTTGGEEFAEGTDASNPEDAEVEPFPRT